MASESSPSQNMAERVENPACARLNNFDCLRLLLAVGVIFSHSFSLTAGTNDGEPLSRLTGGQTTIGTVAVDLFFIMSGYLITGSYLASASVFRYLMKRVRRIYPGFIAAAFFGALIVVPLAGGAVSGRSLWAKFLNFAGSTLRLTEFPQVGAFSRNPFKDAVNGSMWTISYEFWCYIGVMILGVAGLLARRRLVAAVFLCSIAAGVALEVTHRQVSGAWLGVIFGRPDAWSRLLPMYLAGITAYLYRDRIRYSWHWSLVCVSALLIACFVPFGWSGLFPFAGTYVLFWIAFNSSIRAHHAGRFGDFSYGAYLYAFPLQQTIVSSFGVPLTPWQLFLLATPLTLVFAVASWHFIERPFLKTSVKREAKRQIASLGTRAAASGNVS